MKRRKRLLLLALVIAGLLALHRAQRGVIVLHYHAINDFEGKESLISIPQKDFAWQLNYLKTAGYTVVSLEEAFAYLNEGRKLPPKPVAITFDDGYRDNYERALPLLKKHGYPATVFVVTGEIGGTNSWDAAKGFKELALLGWEELRELEKNDISIMPHSVNHLNLTKLAGEDRTRELLASKEALEERLGGKKEYFAYPYGSLNQDLVEAVKAAGYKGAFTSSPGTNIYGRTDLFRIRRLPVKEAHRGFWGRILFSLELKASALFPVD